MTSTKSRETDSPDVDIRLVPFSWGASSTCDLKLSQTANLARQIRGQQSQLMHLAEQLSGTLDALAKENPRGTTWRGYLDGGQEERRPMPEGFETAVVCVERPNARPLRVETIIRLPQATTDHFWAYFRDLLISKRPINACLFCEGVISGARSNGFFAAVCGCGVVVVAVKTGKEPEITIGGA